MMLNEIVVGEGDIWVHWYEWKCLTNKLDNDRTMFD